MIEENCSNKLLHVVDSTTEETVRYYPRKVVGEKKLRLVKVKEPSYQYTMQKR